MTSPRRAPRKPRAPGAAPRRRRLPRIGKARAVGLALAAALAAYAVATVTSFLGARAPGTGRRVVVTWPEDTAAGVDRLSAAGVVERPLLFRGLLVATSPFFTPAPGEHLLSDDLLPFEVVRRLARLTSRDRVRLLVPEGENRFQVGERLESLGVCTRDAFQAAATDRARLVALGIPGDSAEGYLFPATYELFRDTPASTVLGTLVGEATKRLAALLERRKPDFDRAQAELGMGLHEVVTLASVVEKEAARDEERPLIASVFRNRLTDPTFKPARSLQSDPTAVYGCLVRPDLASCREFHGKVLPAMLRDPENAYNTYRRPGLPPGPIANPGLAALEAVLAPAATEYLFFVAAGNGRHVFSRTLEEHEAAIHRR